MVDNLLTALTEALSFYNRSPNMDKQARYDAVVSLSEWGVFNIQHIAQISGLSKTTVYHWVPVKKRGMNGNFNPRTLDILVQLRQNWLNKLPLSVTLMDMVLANGNSQKVASQLTGYSQSAISRRHNGNAGSGLQ